MNQLKPSVNNRTSEFVNFAEATTEITALAREFTQIGHMSALEKKKVEVIHRMFEYSPVHRLLNSYETQGHARREGFKRYMLDEAPSRSAFPIDIPPLTMDVEVVDQFNRNEQLYTAAKLLWAVQKEQAWIRENINGSSPYINPATSKYKAEEKVTEAGVPVIKLLDMRGYKRLSGNYVEIVKPGTNVFDIQKREPQRPVVLLNNIAYAVPRNCSVKEYYNLLRSIESTGAAKGSHPTGLEMTALSASQYNRHTSLLQYNRDYVNALKNAPFIINLDRSSKEVRQEEIARPVGKVFSHAVVNLIVRRDGSSMAVINHAGCDGSHALQFIEKGIKPTLKTYNEQDNATNPTLRIEEIPWYTTDRRMEAKVHEIIEKERANYEVTRLVADINLKNIALPGQLSTDGAVQFLLHAALLRYSQKHPEFPADFSMVESTNSRVSNGRVALPHKRLQRTDDIVLRFLNNKMTGYAARVLYGRIHSEIVKKARNGGDPVERILGATTLAKFAALKDFTQRIYHLSKRIAELSKAFERVVSPTVNTSNLGESLFAGTAPPANKKLSIGIGYTTPADTGKLNLDIIVRGKQKLPGFARELTQYIEEVYTQLNTFT